MKNFASGVAGLLTGLLLVSGQAAHAQSYSFTALDTLGGSFSYAYAINSAGQVVGTASLLNNTTNHAVVWNNGVMTDLDPTGSSASYARAINSSGQIAGYAGQATEWSDGARTSLGPGVAYGLNDTGSVVGDAGRHAAVWSNGSVTDLGTLGAISTASSHANAINNNGQVVGYSEVNGSSAFHATLWQNGSSPVDLGTLGASSSEASAINDAGQIVGWSSYAGGADAFMGHAFLWAGGKLTDLGTLGGAKSGATDINNLGQIVGWADPTGISSSPVSPNEYRHAALWNGSTAIDLNSFLDASSVNAGWVLTRANGINDQGWIVGIAHNNLLNIDRGFVLAPAPVPEPGTYALMALGLGLATAVGRRRAKR